MVSDLHQKYWIPGVSVAIGKTLLRCVVCHRLHAVSGHQWMFDLPQDRVSLDNPPFTRIEVHCFGPFEV